MAVTAGALTLVKAGSNYAQLLSAAATAGTAPIPTNGISPSRLDFPQGPER